MKAFLLLSLTTSYLLSAPAFHKVKEFTNADGTTFLAKAQGNQHLNWVQTSSGEILKYNKTTQNFEYAEIKENDLKTSGTKYEKNNSKRARSLGQVNKIAQKEIYKLWKIKQREHSLRRWLE